MHICVTEYPFTSALVGNFLNLPTLHSKYLPVCCPPGELTAGEQLSHLRSLSLWVVVEHAPLKHQA